ncbi:hypothetical protein ACPYPG_34815 [Streptomyces sp. FR-108]|uniref:hypothetical protein n=1 Tax=Streptomyces sp. FR-108 TaxID=3416665 RepID=UPI003CEBAA4B
MAEGGLYEGDLLSAVLTRNPSVWAESRCSLRRYALARKNRRDGGQGVHRIFGPVYIPGT